MFQDSNGNGVDDSGEPGLQGWTVELETTTGVIEQTATTDVNGDYSFANLLPGTYRVREIGQSGWLQTTGDPADFVIASGTNQTSVNFGNFQLITIGGELFNDLNGNGVLDGNESGVAGWTVDLFLNGALNETTTTDTNGNFSFANLTPGTYRVRVELQMNWVTTNTPARHSRIERAKSDKRKSGGLQPVLLERRSLFRRQCQWDPRFGGNRHAGLDGLSRHQRQWSVGSGRAQHRHGCEWRL